MNLNLVDLLASNGYSQGEIAEALLVSRSTLLRRLKEANMHIGRFTDISDQQLEEVVQAIQMRHPHTRQSLIQGHLVSQGIRVPRRRLEDVLQRLDPIRWSTRWHEVIRRRTYRVPGPNSLWHVDGHHSLVRWRLVIHGGIDGISRLVVFLHCSTNNLSTTVFQLFEEAIRVFGVPSHVRSDKGGENVLVCRFMISYRGVGRGSHIDGASTYKQRIERLWRDVYRCVYSTFHTLFYNMEAAGILDPTSEIDLFVLHYVFLPRINAALQEFAAAWNNHPMWTQRNWSPCRVWLNGMLDPRCSNQQAVRDVVEGIPVEGLDNFGIDYGGPLAAEDGNTVEVPETLSPLDDDQWREFDGELSPFQLTPADDGGAGLFVHARSLLYSL